MGGEDVGQARQSVLVPLQEPDGQDEVVPGAHDPAEHVSCAFFWPPEHETPLPHWVPLFLLLALHTYFPLEQSTAPV